MNIYIASSWRNKYQPAVVEMLRDMGHDVYDFRHPALGDDGFHWSEIDPGWKHWTLAGYLAGLDTTTARNGFQSDFDAMAMADLCVLALPCGRSAHLEAGYFVGAGKKLVICIVGMIEPELMYSMAGAVCGGDSLAIAMVELRKVMLRLTETSVDSP